MSLTLAEYALMLQHSASGAQGAAQTAVRATSQLVEAQARATQPLPSGLTVTFPDQASAVLGAPQPLGVWQDPLQGVWASPVAIPGAGQTAGQLAGNLSVARKQASYRYYGQIARGGRGVYRRVTRPPRAEQHSQRQLQARAGMEIAETLTRVIVAGISGGGGG